MIELPTAISPKELLWLGCREKTCCHTTRVIIGGRDLWRIVGAMELAPWDFTQYAEAIAGAIDGFQLEPGGPAYQVMLTKRGRPGPKGAPCIFLWKLADGHAQCGLGSLRPMVCQSYPALLVDDLLCADGSACTCRRWSTLDLDAERDRALVDQLLAEAAEYAEIVAAWNAGLDGPRSYVDYCRYLVDAYAGREGGVSW
jgi:hypothetical protein